MKNLILTILIACSSLFIFNFTVDKSENKISDKENELSFSFVGDLMCHSPIYESSQVSKDSFDFNPIFREVKSYLTESDFTFGNLETVISGKSLNYSGYPLFNSPKDYLYTLKENGFDILFTANNHCMDRGVTGILNTIENIKDVGLRNVGTYQSRQLRDSLLVIEKNNIKVAILAYTYGLNGNNLPKGKEYLVNQIDTLLIESDINKAKEKKPDAILVYFHFGEEYQRDANSFQKKIACQTINYGADLIIASHPHVIQPIEFTISNNKNFEEGFIAYSLGNFLSNQQWRYSDAGMILNFSLIKNDSARVCLKNIKVIPTWVYKGNINKKNQYRILPSDTTLLKYPDYLNLADKRKIEQSYSDTKRKLIGVFDRNKRISNN